ncbi:MAG: tRNA (N(6)-L-threonylcarbamoyladenosine(37)-C(2))-methylthiotransferase MtaB [Lachnospiraceae bacterium]|nr:tRNA (N(6)-L-threonylcarbamoyladenosine(37)-C(2))-methylthiotransferase MtaB [Lachnospiraceae bacterium]
MKVALHNLGCKVNAYELECMGELMEQAGYTIVDFEKDLADIYIINTCSVTNMADRKSRQMLHRAKKLNPKAIVVAAGCYVQAFPEEVMRDASVDVVIGNNRKRDVVELVEAYLRDGSIGQEENVIDIMHSREYEDMSIASAEHIRAYIKIQDGCNQYCSYCIIPFTRGHVRSRRPGEIYREIQVLSQKKYKEVVLTGIHISSYGLDFYEEKKSYNKEFRTSARELLDLIREISKIEGIERIRLSSLEPRIITEEFVSELVNYPKVCPHFHLSLQSGCNDTLKRMVRGYTAEEFMESCKILRKYYDHPAITTDIIVGFMGETPEEFAQTEDFLEQVKFYEMHVFKFSPRKGTQAMRLKNPVPDTIKTQRSDILLSMTKRQSRAYREYYLGSDVEVLVEEEDVILGKTYMVGHTPNYLKVAIPSSQNVAINDLVKVNCLQMLTEEVVLGTCVK